MLSALLPPLIIWIHGTLPDRLMPVPSWLSPHKIESYHKFFHCDPGLHKVKDLGPDWHHRVIAETLVTGDADQFNMEEFYCFGWSGKLSSAERLKAARHLYAELHRVIAEYEKKYGARPEVIKAISHSHGGNVLLDLTQVKDNNNEIFINELWLLACPVQKETAGYVADEMFGHIYSVHSHYDMIQIADPQGLSELKDKIKKLFAVRSQKALKEIATFFQEKAFFSERHFDSKNVTHVHIVSKKRDLMHVEFLLLSFINALPKICTIGRQIAESENSSCEYTIDIAEWNVQAD